MWKVFKFILIIIVLLILGPWLTSFAYGNINGDSEQDGIRVEAAEGDDIR